MKRVVLILFLSSCFMGINSCKKDAQIGNILINFTNATGENNQNATVGNKRIGNIASNAQTGFIRFVNFGTDSGFPDSDFQGFINNEHVENIFRYSFCATEKSQLKPGKYNIEITLISSDKKYFDLHFK